MKDLLKKLGIYEDKDIILYDGFGYIQGMGCQIKISRLNIGPLRFITNFRFNTDGEWTKTLHGKLNQQAKQDDIWTKGVIESYKMEVEKLLKINKELRKELDTK